ncbi:hypothetical protein FHU30_001930 [Actinomadura rupiterrae]|nr:hypothetical protein [Actinomadura rupiterrae]
MPHLLHSVEMPHLLHSAEVAVFVDHSLLGLTATLSNGAGEWLVAGVQGRGVYMITATPIRQTRAPRMS